MGWWMRRSGGLKKVEGRVIGVWQGVAMNYLKFHLGLLCPTLLHLAGGPILKRPYGRFRGS
jgi:hypothetical protein